MGKLFIVLAGILTSAIIKIHYILINLSFACFFPFMLKIIFSQFFLAFRLCLFCDHFMHLNINIYQHVLIKVGDRPVQYIMINNAKLDIIVDIKGYYYCSTMFSLSNLGWFWQEFR